jgi:zinc transport system substrate-binding protein
MKKRIMTPTAVGVLTIIAMMALAAAGSFGQNTPVPAHDKIRVFVSILPQAYFVDRVGGTRVEVTVLVGPGQSPATYEPSPHDIAHLSNADIYFKIGVPFERRLLEKAQKIIPNLYVVDTRTGITLRPMDDPEAHPGENEGGLDPHIWMNPQLVKIQAASICNELKKLRPGFAEEFDRNLARFQSELDSLDTRIADIMKPFSGRRFFVFHPSYGYFADRYGLKQVAVEVSGKDPGARQLGDLIEQARADSIRTIFAQMQFATGTAEAIAHAIGARVELLDPLAYDYIPNLKTMADKIAAALRNSAAADPAGKKRE